MLALQARGLGFAYRDAAPLFSDVDLHLAPGWHGLVGANGAGKTTLLRLLVGELRPDAGCVVLLPDGARAVLCPQSVELADDRMRDLARASDAASARLRGRLALDAAAVRAGERVVLCDVRLVVRRTERVRLAGANGAGKTTLLQALLAASSLPPERVFFVPQDLRAEDERAVLAELRALPPRERGRTLGLVAALGVDPDRLLASAQPSPGEARKAWIALGLGRHAWLLVLDEPTNHLDLPSLERLEAALLSFPGSLLLVTHDDAFAARTTDVVWRVADGAVRVE